MSNNFIGKDFGKHLTAWREDRGLQYVQLASRVCDVDPSLSCSDREIRKYESGDHYPSFQKLLALAKALELSIDELCFCMPHSLMEATTS